MAMADDLDNLSAEELRAEMLAMGMPNMPITKTTRNVLIKRLRALETAKLMKLMKKKLGATPNGKKKLIPRRMLLKLSSFAGVNSAVISAVNSAVNS